MVKPFLLSIGLALFPICYSACHSASNSVWGGHAYAQDGAQNTQIEFPALIAAARQGDALAQYNLGVVFEHGIGVDKDPREAANWYLLAAKQQLAAAQNNLGVLYNLGKGVGVNTRAAVKWFRLSADQGYALGQFNLAFCYEKGRGLPQDDAKATFWYQKAADQHDVAATYRLGRLYQSSAKTKTQALSLLNRAAEAGYAPAQNAIAIALYHKNPATEKAVNWLISASEKGYKQADLNLGLVYFHQGDFKKAKSHFIALLDEGKGIGAAAAYHLGVLYDHGKGTAPNPKEAIKWYKKASEQGYGPAQFNLGSLYVLGEGTQQNLKEGRYWIQKAANQGVERAQAALRVLNASDK